MCRWRARRPGACRRRRGPRWRILSAWWRLRLSALSVVSSLTCSRVKTLRSSTALGRGGTSSVFGCDDIGHLPQLGAVASTILQKASAYSCSDKALFRPKLISEQRGERKEVYFRRSQASGKRARTFAFSRRWSPIVLAAIGRALGCVLRSQSESPAKKFSRPRRMWSALSLPCNRRSASSRTNDAELGRPRRGAFCAGCSTAGVTGYTLT